MALLLPAACSALTETPAYSATSSSTHTHSCAPGHLLRTARSPPPLPVSNPPRADARGAASSPCPRPAAQAGSRVVDEVGEVLGFAVARAVDADDEGGEAQDAGDVVPDPVALAPRVGVRADEVGVVGEGFEVRRSRILEPAELGFVHVDAHLRLLPRHLRELLALELRQGAALGEVPLVQGLAALVAARVRSRGPGLAGPRWSRGRPSRRARSACAARAHPRSPSWARRASGRPG